MRRGRLALFTLLALIVFLAVAAAAAAQPIKSEEGVQDSSKKSGRYIEIPGNYRGFTYYSEFGAILRSIAKRSDRVYSMKTVGYSAGGPTSNSGGLQGVTAATPTPVQFNLNGSHPLWNIVVTWPMSDRAWDINADFRRAMISDPDEAMCMLNKYYSGPGIGHHVRGSEIIRPVFFLNCSIHGGEQTGADAGLKLLRRLAFKNDDQTKRWLKNVIVVIDPVQNPDGRINGTRGNGNGFDCNRDFITLTQPEDVITAATERKWLPETMIDLHTSANPLLCEPTTIPHNPNIEFDVTYKWEVPLGDYMTGLLQETEGQPTQIPYWWGTARDDLGDVNEGWDDYGPYYTPQLAQEYGAAAFTVETNYASTFDGVLGHYTITKGGLDFTSLHGDEMVRDHVKYMARGANSQSGGRPWQGNIDQAIRAAVFDPITNAAPTQNIAWGQPGFPYSNTVGDITFPYAYVVPVGAGMQRNVFEAYKVLNHAAWYGIKILKAKKSFVAGGVTYPAGTFIVPMRQALRGLANNLFWDGEDVKAKYGVSSMYDISAWSLKYAYGIDAARVATAFKLPPTCQVRNASPDRVINNYNAESTLAGPVGLEQVPTSIKREGDINGSGTVFWWKGDSIAAVRMANQALKFNYGVGSVGMVTRQIAAPYNTIPLGAFVINFTGKSWGKGLLNNYSKKLGIDFNAAPGLLPTQVSQLATPSVSLNSDVNTRFVITQMLGFTSVNDPTLANNLPAPFNLTGNNDFYYSTSSGDDPAEIGSWLAGSTAIRQHTYWASQSANSQSMAQSLFGNQATTYTIDVITADPTNTKIHVTAPTSLVTGDYVVISGANSAPTSSAGTINRTQRVTVIDTQTFTIAQGTSGNGTTGKVTVPYLAIARDRSSSDNGFMATDYAQNNALTAGYAEHNYSFAYPPSWYHVNSGAPAFNVDATFRAGLSGAGSYLQGFWNYPSPETVNSPAMVDETAKNLAVPAGTITGISTTTSSGISTITVAAGHRLVNGGQVTLSGTNSTPAINGTFLIASVPTSPLASNGSPTTFTINPGVTVTAAGTAGTMTAPAAAGKVVFSGFNPTYRGYQDNTALVLARAIFLSRCTPPSVP
jgi:hypothetical protein